MLSTVDPHFPKVQLALIILNCFLFIWNKDDLLYVTVLDNFKSSEQAIVQEKKFPQDLKNFLSKPVQMIRFTVLQADVKYLEN